MQGPKQKFLDDVQCRRGTPLGRPPSQPILKLQRSEGSIASAPDWSSPRKSCPEAVQSKHGPTLRFCLGWLPDHVSSFLF